LPIPFAKTNLGTVLQETQANGGMLSNGVSMLGRGLGRSLIAGTGGMAGKGSELAFDTATGQYRGKMQHAPTGIFEAGVQTGTQGLIEGAAEAKAAPHAPPHGAAAHDETTPRPAAHPEADQEVRAPLSPLDAEGPPAPPRTPGATDARVGDEE